MGNRPPIASRPVSLYRQAWVDPNARPGIHPAGETAQGTPSTPPTYTPVVGLSGAKGNPQMRLAGGHAGSISLGVWCTVITGSGGVKPVVNLVILSTNKTTHSQESTKSSSRGC